MLVLFKGIIFTRSLNWNLAYTEVKCLADLLLRLSDLKVYFRSQCVNEGLDMCAQGLRECFTMGI